METRLTLRPGQNGTKKLVERYGERLLRGATSTARRAAGASRAKCLGAVWRPAQKVWEIT